jgi:TRAP-type C4-dicarboxylate transport system permease small subunit
MQIVRFIQTVNRYLFALGAVPLFIATILTVIDVSGRYIRLPLPGTLETSTLCLALSVALTLAHTQALKGNTDVMSYTITCPARVTGASLLSCA